MYKNMELRRATRRARYAINPDPQKNRIKLRRALGKMKASDAVYHKEKRKDLLYRIMINLRVRIYTALKNNQKIGSAVRDLGCSIEELKQHLESKFKFGMTWKNWGVKGWHIDHIKPLVSFNLQDRVQFLEACHFSRSEEHT